MKTPDVCTEPATYRRIVSSNPQPLGASTSSRRIRREENHFIFAVGTRHHLCARTRYGSKMFTLQLQTVDLILINLIYSLTEGSILDSVPSPFRLPFVLCTSIRNANNSRWEPLSRRA